jgi:hypothetical protein
MKRLRERETAYVSDHRLADKDKNLGMRARVAGQAGNTLKTETEGVE